MKVHRDMEHNMVDKVDYLLPKATGVKPDAHQRNANIRKQNYTVVQAVNV